MRIVITGGAGFLGRKLAQAIVQRGTMTGPEGRDEQVSELVLVDTYEFEPDPARNIKLTSVAADICDPQAMSRIITSETASVYHLAAVVSGQAEADFDLGYRINLDGTRNLLEACRAIPHAVKFVTTSSVATFGGEMPDEVPDDFTQRPSNSYGAQKAIGEILVNDYSRKGFIDGYVLRLPTVIVRPGSPNAAASSFVSSIIREPLQGQAAICPVGDDLPIWVMSPRRVIESLVKVHNLGADGLGGNRTITLPGISVTPALMVSALERIAGSEVVRRIEWKFDKTINEIVSGWPGAFEAKRAKGLGFAADDSIDEIILAFMEDDISVN
jgi:D-erythronate 2-dehydrogenase